MPQPPTLQAFKRLSDARTHWLQALESYFLPEKFRLELNACIQDMRSVTFLLQKCKSEIPNFEKWYSGWQIKMKSDSLMKWVLEARNKIVKEGDLQLHSLLRVSVVGSYLDSEVPYVQYKAPPKLNYEEIRRDALKLKIPSEVLKTAYLKIERRWVDHDFSKHETLSALSYCWEFLAKLLSDAPVIQDKLIANPYATATLPACMIDTDDIRSEYIKLATGKFATLTSQAMEINRKDAEATCARYGDANYIRDLNSVSSFRELSEFYFERAKRVLQVDGYHGTIVILLFEDRPMCVTELRSEDQADKYLMWRNMGLEVKRSNATGLIAISEAWFASFDPTRPYMHVAEREDRKEVLQLIAISKAGEEISLTSQFYRDGKKITFDKTNVEDNLVHTNFLAPVKNAWKD